MQISGGKVNVDSVTTMNLNVPMEFHCVDTNLIPVGDLENSAYIDVEHVIVVELVRKGLKKNMRVHVPVKIGNVESSTTSKESTKF